MKKVLKIILINILLIIFLLVGLEIYFYIKDTKFLKKNPSSNENKQSFKKNLLKTNLNIIIRK